MDFLRECSEEPLFKKICPISEIMTRRYEDQELVLRFFAFLDNYEKFHHSVDTFLNKYVEDIQKVFDDVHKEKMKTEFLSMLDFVDKNFKNGFAKKENAKSTPRVRFEAISVGVALAIREKHDLQPKTMEWLDSEEFKKHTTTHASNSPKRVRGRFLYVRDNLLEGAN